MDALDLTRLKGCHPLLLKLFLEVDTVWPCRIACGARSAAEQQAAYDAGRSQRKPGTSLHERVPSLAADVYPYVDGKLITGDPSGKDKQTYQREIVTLAYFAGTVREIARKLEIPIHWGCDWDDDLNIFETNLMDMPHFELVETKL